MSKEINRTEMLKIYILANSSYPDNLNIHRYSFIKDGDAAGSFAVEFSVMYGGFSQQRRMDIHLLDLIDFWLNHKIPDWTNMIK